MASNPSVSRALLLGLSLAELMIIIVFVLLILLGNEKQASEKQRIFERSLGSENARQLIDIIVSNPQVANFGEELKNDAKKLVSDVNLLSPKAPPSPPPADPVIEPDGEMTREQALDALDKMRKKLEEVTSENSKLTSQIIAKAGEMVFCTYLASPESRNGKRSLALGAVYVQKDGITLMSREPLLYSEPIIYDYNLNRYDVTAALNVLDEWPIGRKLTKEEFVDIGAKFLAIGEKSDAKRNTCRFALNYHLEVIEGTDNVEGRVLEMLDKVVQGYFFKGVKIESKEPSSRVEADKNPVEGLGVSTEYKTETNAVMRKSCDLLADTGNPGVSDYLLCGDQFAIGFSCAQKSAMWVFYRVDPELHDAVDVSRQNNFRADLRVPLECQNDLGNFPKGFDRGHLASSATFDNTIDVNSETFMATNLVPQRLELNRGLWRRLEQAERDLSDKFGLLNVITGPLFLEKEKLVENGILLPNSFYKIIYVESLAIAFSFLLPNEQRLKRSLDSYVVSIDEVESLTGLDFLSNLSSPGSGLEDSVREWKELEILLN